MKIGKFLTPSGFWTIAFVVSVFILFFIGSISLRQIQALSISQESVNRSHKIRIDLERLFSELKDAETAQRGYIITRDVHYLEPTNYAHVRINKSLIGLKELTKENTVRQRQIEELTLLVNKRFRLLRNNLLAINRISVDSDSFREMMLQEKIVMDSIRKLVDDIIKREAIILEKQEKAYGDEMFFTPLLSLLLVIFSVLVFLFTFLHITRNLRHLKKLNHSLKLMNETFIDAERIGEISHWQLDIETKKFWFSDNKYRLMGYEAQIFEPTVERFLEIVFPADRGKVRNSFEKAGTTQANTVYFRIRRPDKKVRYIKSVSKLTHDSEGREIVIGVDVDITNHHKNTLKLERKNLLLKRSNEELTSFNHIASHDLQEPLRKIQMFISRIDESEFLQFSPQTQTYISRIQSSAHRAQLLIDDLLIYSRVSRDDIRPELVNLNQLLLNAEIDLSRKIQESNAIIKSDTLPEVKVVAHQVQQLFINLLSNSIKYQKEGSQPKIIISHSIVKGSSITNVKVSPLKSYHAITFEDNGIGFDQKYAERIFVLFHRLHDGKKYSGTGIGLAICRKMAENQNGHIFATGSSNGATFTLLLPISREM